MDKNAYFELGVRLAIQQAGFEKDAGVLSAVGRAAKKLLKKKPPKKDSIKAWRKTDKAKKLMAQKSVTDTKTYGAFRQGKKLREKATHSIGRFE